MSLFTLQAGRTAFAHIQREGLRVEDVAAIFGASGAAKWLSISGLDKALFGEWLPQGKQNILLFGTSVGAFKLAAAAQRDPVVALNRLATAYVEQEYPDGLTKQAIAEQLDLILDKTIPDAAIDDIINHPRYAFSCGATICPGLLGSEQLRQQSMGMVGTGLRELAPSALGMQAKLERIVFGVEQAATMLRDDAGQFVNLRGSDLKRAIIASGSLPLYMHGVQGLHQETLRDGGLLDYHPVPDNLLSSHSNKNGLVLYPHFFPHLVERWFDKFYPWRKVTPQRLDNVVLISPSKAYCESLELGRIPDRRDFQRFEKRDGERMRLWREAIQRSDEMGEMFLHSVRTGQVAEQLTLIGDKRS